MTELPEKEDKPLDDKEFIQKIIKVYKNADQQWADIRKAALNDVDFYRGNQSDNPRSRAINANKQQPKLQVNRLPNIVNSVESRIRDLNPSISVHATDEKGSEKTAKIFQGIIRHIEHQSNAKSAYITAAGANGALVPGIGFIKLSTEYVDENSFDQNVLIEEIKDSFSIIPDYNTKKSDFSDATFWFEFTDISKDEFKEHYPDSELSNVGSWTNMHLNPLVLNTQVRLVKYWYKEEEEQLIVLFEDGSKGVASDYGIDENGNDVGTPKVQRPMVETSDQDKQDFIRYQAHKGIQNATPPDYRPAEVVNSRMAEKHIVKWVLTNGVEILDRGDWHCDEFPFVAFVGRDSIVEGKRDIHGIIRYAKDSQKMLNYMSSQFVKKIAAANNSPWIAAIGSIPENLKQAWNNSNIDPKAVLYYNPTHNGNPLPPPQRADAIEPAVQALLAGAVKCENDIKAVVGVYDAGLGATPNNQSGIAIQTLSDNGERANLHFSDNFTMSMKRLGCLLVKLIPKIYDTPRVVRIIGADEQQELIKINQMFTKNGSQENYNIGESGGYYDVVIDTGPTFATRKAEQSESMLKFAAADPQLMPVIADLIAANLDWDDNNLIRDRIVQFQANTMPWLHKEDNLAVLEQVPPEVKTQFAKLMAQLNQANQHVQTLQQEYSKQKTINDTHVLINSSKERVQQIKSFTDLQLAKMKLMSEIHHNQEKNSIDRTKMELGHIHSKQKMVLEGIKHMDNAMGSDTQQQDVNDMQQMLGE